MVMYGNQGYFQRQTYTPPTIHADIILASEQEAENYGVAAGTTQMFCARDDSAFYIKTAYPNGQFDFMVYERRPQKKEPQPDYVTRSELEEIISKLNHGGQKDGNVRETTAKH